MMEHSRSAKSKKNNFCIESKMNKKKGTEVDLVFILAFISNCLLCQV